MNYSHDKYNMKVGMSIIEFDLMKFLPSIFEIEAHLLIFDSHTLPSYFIKICIYPMDRPVHIINIMQDIISLVSNTWNLDGMEDTHAQWQKYIIFARNSIWNR